MRAHTVLRRELEAEVLSPRGLTINDFEALLHLCRADDNRLRRVDLVELLMLTPSGVTRLLDGLQEAGLVENVSCEDDARVTWAAADRGGRRDARVRRRRATRSCCARSSATGSTRTRSRSSSELLGKLPGVGAGSCAG